ncbi:carbohydrate ABC transporter permease [Phytoactinopolyspora limicola]|uniref:carbohydrate ABC transporter permease n=1 Tax=Phytoactinopolyspora limicola TaxID=2715536 RepID=UPI001A9C4E52|nr:sugar ABC transporter permease [Phytoactinopolyspora limicola]
MRARRQPGQLSDTPNGRDSRRRHWLPYVLILPAVVAELIIHVVPIVLGVWTSMTQLTQLHIRDWTNAPVIWFDNYRHGLDPAGAIGSALGDTVLRTLAFTVLVVALSWIIGMLAAYVLNTRVRGARGFRLLFLVPFAVPTFASVLAWSFMFSRDQGAVNHVLVDQFGLLDERPFWLIGDNAFWAMVVVAVWRLWPFAFLMLLAALQGVPGELDDAAAVDGASRWRTFRSITLPAIRPVNAVVILIMGLWSFNEFSVPYVLFGPRPPESATLLAALIYEHSFVHFGMGLGAAMNVLVLMFLLGVSLLFLRLFVPHGRRHA